MVDFYMGPYVSSEMKSRLVIQKVRMIVGANGEINNKEREWCMRKSLTPFK